LKVAAETSKLNNIIKGFEADLQKEVEIKNMLDKTLYQTKADYEQELNKLAIRVEKIEADAVNEAQEIDRMMKSQTEATNIAIRDIKDDVDSNRIKANKEHNAQIHELQTELDKLDTALSKTTREGTNETNKGELKIQRAGEKIKQDEQKNR